MVKLWISDKLELRWNEWPEKEFWPEGTEKYEDNARAIAKAKQESMPFENQLQMRWLLSGLSPEADAIYGNRAFEEKFSPDTFIDYAGEVETGWQWRAHDTDPWQDTNEQYASTVGLGNPCAKTRKVARLKPVNAAHSFTEAMSETEMNAHLDALENKPPHGMKARILEAFCREYDGESMAYEMLIKVLDELNIK